MLLLHLQELYTVIYSLCPLNYNNIYFKQSTLFPAFFFIPLTTVTGDVQKRDPGNEVFLSHSVKAVFFLFEN